MEWFVFHSDQMEILCGSKMQRFYHEELSGVATMAALVSLGVGSAATSQYRQSLPTFPVNTAPAPTQTTDPPPVMAPPPPTVAIESEDVPFVDKRNRPTGSFKVE